MIRPFSRTLYAFEMNLRHLSYLSFSYPKWFGFSLLSYHLVLAIRSQVLCFTMFHYILLYFTIFHYVLLYFTMFYYISLCFAIFYYVLLYFTVFCYILQCFTILYYILLCFAIFYYVSLISNMLHEQEEDPKLYNFH